MNCIELKNASYTYSDGTEAIKDVSLKIKEGKKIAFLGANGSGKSTLFFLLNGLFKLQKGEYSFFNDIIKYNKKQRNELLKNIGIVFQDPDVQLFATTVYQEISFGPKNFGFEDEYLKKQIEKSMDIMDVNHLKDKATHLISYGEKKRVTIASIISLDPKILIFDEPFAWLDQRHAREMREFLNSLDDEQTVIISSHDPDFVLEWADYVYILKEGEIISQGNPLDVFNDDETLNTAELTKPFVLSVAEALGLNEIPKTKEELLKKLSNI